jgi:hypothetical protein
MPLKHDMRPLAIIVAVYLSATALAVAVAVGRPPLSRVTTSISSLGEQVFRIQTTLQALPAFPESDTDPEASFQWSRSAAPFICEFQFSLGPFQRGKWFAHQLELRTRGDEGALVSTRTSNNECL